MALHIRNHRALCSCFPKKVSSEQSIGDVRIAQMDWKRVPQARSSCCKSSVTITTERSRHHAGGKSTWLTCICETGPRLRGRGRDAAVPGRRYAPQFPHVHGRRREHRRRHYQARPAAPQYVHGQLPTPTSNPTLNRHLILITLTLNS